MLTKAHEVGHAVYLARATFSSKELVVSFGALLLLLLLLPRTSTGRKKAGDGRKTRRGWRLLVKTKNSVFASRFLADASVFLARASYFRIGGTVRS